MNLGFSARMVFSYYTHLSQAQKRIYRRSDEFASIPLPAASDLAGLVRDLASTLESKDRRLSESLCQKIADGIFERLRVGTTRVEVLSVRPRHDWGELHGLYFPKEDRRQAKIQLWMRTAQHKRIVAFKTFLRTLLHEICHHLDYELHGLSDSLHTEGFYKRVSSLFHQLHREG